jgi:hypothetical protein
MIIDSSVLCLTKVTIYSQEMDETKMTIKFCILPFYFSITKTTN